MVKGECGNRSRTKKNHNNITYLDSHTPKLLYKMKKSVQGAFERLNRRASDVHCQLYY